MRDKPEIGQKLIIEYYSNRDCWYKLAIVSKVGRKYFEVEIDKWYSPIRFHLENWKEVTNYSSSYTLYANYEEIQEKIRREHALKALRQYFSGYSQTPASADQLMLAIEALDLKDAVESELVEKLSKIEEQLG